MCIPLAGINSPVLNMSFKPSEFVLPKIANYDDIRRKYCLIEKQKAIEDKNIELMKTIIK